jgi:hypothetical protein
MKIWSSKLVYQLIEEMWDKKRALLQITEEQLAGLFLTCGQVTLNPNLMRLLSI